MGQSLGRDRLEALAGALRERRSRMEFSSRTARLIDSGIPKMAQKLVEEAAEVAIDAVQGERQKVIEESADLMFNLTELEISPNAVWEEMDRRQKRYGLAEKRPKDK